VYQGVELLSQTRLEILALPFRSVDDRLHRLPAGATAAELLISQKQRKLRQFNRMHEIDGTLVRAPYDETKARLFESSATCPSLPTCVNLAACLAEAPYSR
jgi:hypothetical protein